ncbi:MAG: DNA repair protein RadA [Candidatus Eisenbacteria bacterium]|uniref:DNA repair protein RadA n=1 Tax=Eiseniibacteriota bacterium TaxID=2212470 RepID=A0A849SJG2_UNCEI|nr:DNA repair protein RadA [Candidatus Eisenbacteria bacterium]
MKKKAVKAARSHFFCTQCGNEESRWFGHCASCGAWNSAAEAPAAGSPSAGTVHRSSTAAARARWQPGETATAVPRPLADVEVSDVPRFPTGMRELDRVLGGGIVPGSLLLVGGDPGIGKSTLLLQVASRLAAAGRRVLLVAGEESAEQVRLRAERLGALPQNLLILCETDLERVLEAAAARKPDVMVVDSIQTMARSDLEGGPGSVTQVRECGLELMHFAKASGAAVFLVGHVTKDGGVAGPRVLEHLVDAVLYLEGERYQQYRVLRAAKNRFGSTHELGVFEMGDRGLIEVDNPSAAFLSGGDREAPGAAVVASLEGSRPLLVEVQALVSTSFYGTPQRVTSGFDPRRLAVLLAVLERRVGLRLGRHDVFVSVTGGLKLDEPGTDLGVALAVASSFRNRPLLARTCAIGEVSLSGELRAASRLELRVREAAQLGFARVGAPAAQARDLDVPGIEIVPLATLREACDQLLGERVESAVPAAGTGAVPAAGARATVASTPPRASRRDRT